MPVAGVLTIDTSAIPEFQRVSLAKGALEVMDLAFAQPDAEERYQAWLKERQGKAKKRRRRKEVQT